MPTCPRCQQSVVTRDGHDRHRRQRFGCAGCGRDFTIRSASAFSGYRWPRTRWSFALLRTTGLASGNALVAAAIGLAMGVAFARRIEVEEAMLAQQLGQAYHDYMQRTWRLLPLVY
jgi:hypothetical protein